MNDDDDPAPGPVQARAYLTGSLVELALCLVDPDAFCASIEKPRDVADLIAEVRGQGASPAEIAQVVGLVRNYLATARSEAEVVAYREERKRHRLSSLIKQGDEMADRRASRATVRALAAVVARPSEEAATDEAS